MADPKKPVTQPRLPGNVVIVPGLDAQPDRVASAPPRAPINPNTTSGGLKGK